VVLLWLQAGMALQLIQMIISFLLLQLPSTFDLALTDSKFKFPQVWKTNIAVDQNFPVL
jgi:hypothetical protein